MKKKLQKFYLHTVSLLVLLGMPGAIFADISWDPAASSHTGTGMGFNLVPPGPGVPPGTGITNNVGVPVYGGGQNNAGVFAFGLTNAASPNPSLADTDLSATILPAGTVLTLYFDKDASDEVNYVAVIANPNAAITYEVISDTRVKIVATIVDTVASASGDVGAAFGLVIDYQDVEALDFKQTVFATNMHHFDVNPPATQTSGVAAINANGSNGVSATFRAFMPTTFLNSIGLTDPSQCKGYVDGLETPPGDFANEGLDDTLGFDFMDVTNPNNTVLKVVINNDAWSPHDLQFGQIQAPVDPNIAKRARIRRNIKKTKRLIRKAKTSSKKRRLKKKLRRLKRQLRNLS